jgi:hypothetical protein
MRDDDLTFADRMSRDLREVRWPEPAEIRARARRRSRRTAVAAATAVLAVASLAAVAVGGPADPPAASWADRWWSAAGPEPSWAAAEIPPEALLAPTDVGVPNNVALSDTGLEEPVRVEPLLEACAAARGLAAGPVVSRYSRSQTLLQDDTPDADGPSGTPVLTQDVYRLAGGGSARVFVELDRMVAGCAGWRDGAPRYLGPESGGTPVLLTHTWEAVERDFAGDEAVLLRKTSAEPVDAAAGKRMDWRFLEEARLLVRVGDLVTVIVPAGAFGVVGPEFDRRTSDAQLLALGRSAARRMCPAAAPPC